jgi:methylated-DNA-[protein]-cysteine S-methyltransferase
MPRLFIATPLGECALFWSGDVVTGFRLPEVSAAKTGAADEAIDSAPAWVHELARRVQLHVARTFQDFADAPFDWSRVSEFQRAVYATALTVKAGSTWSYGQVAAALGLPPGGARAVGVALGQNPWPLLVPCHRFIGADGKMTGFSAPGGTKTKLKLLALEGAQLFAE